MFISSVRAAVLIGTGCSAAAAQSPLVVEQIAPNLYRIETTAGSNVLALGSEEFTVLVDAGPHDGARRLQATLDSMGLSPVRYVITTHYHDDHLGGNRWFKERGAVVIAHVATEVEALRDTMIVEWNDWRREAASREALPDLRFEAGMSIRVGAHTIQVTHAGNAHTGGDAVVAVPELHVIHTGDIYEVGAYPFIDHWAGGSIRGMIAAVDGLLGRDVEGAVFVPGHGPPGGHTELRAYRNMLHTTCIEVQAGLDRGHDVEAVVATQPTSPFDNTSWGATRHGRSLTALIYWSLQNDSTGNPCG